MKLNLKQAYSMSKTNLKKSQTKGVFIYRVEFVVTVSQHFGPNRFLSSLNFAFHRKN